MVEHIFSEGQLRGLGLFSVRRLQGELIAICKHFKRSSQKLGHKAFVTGPVAMGQGEMALNSKRGDSHWV